MKLEKFANRGIITVEKKKKKFHKPKNINIMPYLKMMMMLTGRESRFGR